MKKKVFALLLSGLIIFAACKGLGPAGKKDDNKIRLGNNAPLSGAVSAYGITTNEGIKMAIDEINKNGGIMGKKVEWYEHDDQGNITQAAYAYNKLMDGHVDAILGGITSKTTLAISEASQEDMIPVITPTGTQADITEGKSNVFRTCYTDPYQGSLLAIFANDSLKARSFAVLSNASSDYSQGIAKAFIKKAEELGMVKVAEESYSDGDTDFKAQLTNIRGRKPDVVVLPDYYEKVALIVPQARQLEIQANFLGGDGWDGVLNTMDPSQYETTNQCYFTNHFAIDSQDAKVKKFVDSYKNKYSKDPTAFAALGYDTVYLIKQAMEEAGTTDYDPVCRALEKINFDGVTGAFKYDSHHNPVKSATMIRIEDGKYKFDSIVSPR